MIEQNFNTSAIFRSLNEFDVVTIFLTDNIQINSEEYAPLLHVYIAVQTTFVRSMHMMHAKYRKLTCNNWFGLHSEQRIRALLNQKKQFLCL